jgi:hypothetical protein
MKPKQSEDEKIFRINEQADDGQGGLLLSRMPEPFMAVGFA